MQKNPTGICQCGCGEPVAPGRQYRQGHNRRRPWTRTVEDRGYRTPCWVWGGASRSKKGYGGVRADGRTQAAHRAVYEKLKGAIPEGLELDHLCRVRACVNPDHLEPVTTRENILRGNAPAAINARKTHCIRGHEFTPANTIVGRGGKARTCRACMKAYLAAYYLANKEKWAA